jgi:tetratricopeptide (TPR) repeat protein
MGPMTPRGLAILALCAALWPAPRPFAAPSRKAGGPAPRAAPQVAGAYDSPLGRVAIELRGASAVGTLVEPSAQCPFPAGEEVLRATLLDDSLAGKVRVWLRGEGCAREAWASAVLLASAGGLSGAVHLEEKGCTGPLGEKGGLSLTRAAAGGARPAVRPAGARDGRRERAQALLRDGAAWLQEGSFEAARKRFLEAAELDPRIPEALNGVGVTYRMRNELGAALDWYKKALAVDPDFGDAYYNMACVYALQGEKELALRYLQIAALNGYATAEGIDGDPDLAALHDEAAYRALVKAHL